MWFVSIPRERLLIVFNFFFAREIRVDLITFVFHFAAATVEGRARETLLLLRIHITPWSDPRQSKMYNVYVQQTYASL